MTPVERVLVRLPGARRSGGKWMAHCPAHRDRSPSLCISEGSGKRALLHCFAGCPIDSVLKALGLSLRDLHDNLR